MADFAMAFGHELWHVACDMSLFLLLGFVLAGVLAVAVPASVVERHLGRRSILSVLKATFMGLPLPLCSCGIVPVAAAFRRHGAGRGSTAAFMASTPQIGVDSVLVTVSLLGPVFAALRVACAIASGFAVGLASHFTPEVSDGAPEAACNDACCAAAAGQSRVSRALRIGLVTLPGEIGASLVAGLVAAAAIAALIPGDFFARLAGGGVTAMLLMMAAGIPVYVCATASVPIAAALMSKGVSPGAALVFLMTGPVTNLAAFSAVWKILGRRTAAVYLLSVAAAALVSGLAADAVLGGGFTARPAEVRELIPREIEIAGVFALGAVLLWSWVSAFLSRRGSDSSSAGAGESCGHDHAGQGQSHGSKRCCDHDDPA